MAMLQHGLWPALQPQEGAGGTSCAIFCSAQGSCCGGNTESAAALQYCLPTDAPHLARTSRALAAALSPMVWAQHKPDRFDSFSAGALWSTHSFHLRACGRAGICCSVCGQSATLANRVDVTRSNNNQQ